MIGSWAILHTSVNSLDGRRTWLEGAVGTSLPTDFSGYITRLFATRKLARQWIAEHHGYLRRRPDLRAEPHGWRPPRPVKVSVTIVEKGETR